MSLTVATLIPAVILLVLGALFLVSNSAIVTTLKSFPRSQPAAVAFFGTGAAMFLYRVWHLAQADFGDYRKPLFVGFAIIAVLSFKMVPDFLAVRGLSVVILVGAWSLLDAAFQQYDIPQRLWMVSIVYAAIALAIYLGASPFRLRDFFDWVFRAPGRARVVGGALAVYGLILTGVAFSY